METRWSSSLREASGGRRPVGGGRPPRRHHGPLGRRAPADEPRQDGLPQGALETARRAGGGRRHSAPAVLWAERRGEEDAHRGAPQGALRARRRQAPARAPRVQDADEPHGGDHDVRVELPHRDEPGRRRLGRPVRRAGGHQGDGPVGLGPRVVVVVVEGRRRLVGVAGPPRLQGRRARRGRPALAAGAGRSQAHDGEVYRDLPPRAVLHQPFESHRPRALALPRHPRRRPDRARGLRRAAEGRRQGALLAARRVRRARRQSLAPQRPTRAVGARSLQSAALPVRRRRPARRRARLGALCESDCQRHHRRPVAATPPTDARQALRAPRQVRARRPHPQDPRRRVAQAPRRRSQTRTHPLGRRLRTPHPARLQGDLPPRGLRRALHGHLQALPRRHVLLAGQRPLDGTPSLFGTRTSFPWVKEEKDSASGCGG
mmetsp:Transcript_9336/g.38286  ORF Transcript_9336/g.38286 Transcript_9336/m.38286 type:complete len:432 (-) Transcript_9336:35-1330(-)